MLIIRSEQMEVLETYASERFFESLVSAVSPYFAGVEDLRGRVASAVERAGTYGIFDRDDLLWFLHLDLQRGAAWELQPAAEWAFDILDAPQSDVAGRRYRLEKRMRQLEPV